MSESTTSLTSVSLPATGTTTSLTDTTTSTQTSTTSSSTAALTTSSSTTALTDSTSTTSTTGTTSTTATTLSTTSLATGTTSSTTSTTGTTSSPTDLTTAAPVTTISSTSSTSEIITTADGAGGIATVTTVVPITPTTVRTTGSSAAATASSSSSSSGGFWNNKGAVAGVFTVVGLIAFALLIVLITTTIRRRRARQYDRELAEAAAPGPGPVYLDDDDDFPARSKVPGGGGGGTGFSDVSSHGTYAQNPMSTESYGMSEMPSAPADYGQAGIGVSRTRSMGALPGGGGWLNAGEGGSPYPAFMQAGAPQHPGYDGGYNDMNNTVPAAPPVAYGTYGEPIYPERQQSPPHSYPDYPPATTTSDLTRQGSQSLLSGTTSPTSPGESYASHYQPGFILPPSHDGTQQQPQPEIDDGRPKILKVANE